MISIPNTLSGKIKSVQGYWAGRNTKIDDLWKLIVDTHGMPGTDFNANIATDTVVGNDPITDLSLAVHLLSSLPPRHTILVTPGDNIKEANSGIAERALQSIWSQLDDERLEVGLDLWLRELTFWIGLTGWYAIAPRVEVENGHPVFIADIMNPKTAYPQYGDRGLSFFLNRYTTSLQVARDKADLYGTKLSIDGSPDISVDIANVWEKRKGRIYNSIVLASHNQMIKPEEEMPFESIPILCGPVGGIPRYSAAPSVQTVSGSILWQNERIYRTMDKWRSYQMQLAKLASKAPFLASGTNLEVTEEEVSKLGLFESSSIIWTPNPQSNLRQITVNPSPVDIRVLDSIYDAMRQRGGFPALLFGGFNVNLSGFAISQVLNIAFHRLGPHKRALQRIIGKVGRVWIDGLRESGVKSLNISGKSEHKFFREEIDISQLPKEFDIQVELKLALPNDLIQRVQIARNAIGDNRQLADMTTVIEDIMQLDDPKLVMERIEEDRVDNDPIMNLFENIILWRKKAAEARQRGKGDIADLMEQMIQLMIQQVQTMAGRGKGTQATGLQGVGPETLPPEAQGISPDLANAIVNNTQTPTNVRGT